MSTLNDLKSHYENQSVELPIQHRDRFEQRLNKELHSKKNNSTKKWWIAASVLFFLSVSVFIFNKNEPVNEPEFAIISDISPEFNRIESYYETAIKYELLKLDLDEEEQPFLKDFFIQFNKLTEQYQELNTMVELNKIDEKLINALIDNLQARLKLLLKLKEQINYLKQQKNETISL